MKCPYCNEYHSDDYQFCPNTGKKIESDYSKQSNCISIGNHPSTCRVNEHNVNNPYRFTNMQQCRTNHKSLEYNGYQFVDLGLTSGTLWASCNIGAKEPQEYGDYFSWGETDGYMSGKTDFGDRKYKWYRVNIFHDIYLTKYSLGAGECADGKAELELFDDCASHLLGGNCRMPSSEQFKELISECKNELMTFKGVQGYLFTSNSNKNTIFLPCGGYRKDKCVNKGGSRGYYWSRNLKDRGYAGCILFFKSRKCCLDSQWRETGCNVRPVISNL